MNKKLKWLLIILGSLGILAMILVMTAVSFLPGPSEVAQMINGDKPPKASVEVSEPKALPQANVEAAAQTDEKELKERAEKEKNKELVLGFINEPITDMRVCENLGQSKIFKKNQKKEEKMTFDDMFKDEARTDSIAESLRIPIKAVFHEPIVANFLGDVMKVDTSKLNPGEKDSLLKKLGFYSRAALMANHLVDNKQRFEVMADRAINLSVLARIAIKKPEAIESLNLRGLCEQMERSLASDEEVSAKKERQQILKLISDAGLSPAELHFEPDEYAKFGVNFSGNNISFSLTTKEGEEKK